MSFPKGNAKECSKYDDAVVLISHGSKVVVKNLSSWASVVCELKTSICISRILKRQRNQRGRYQILNICWIMREAREFQKKIFTSASRTMIKPLTVWIPTNCKILKEKRIPDHITCLLKNLYAVQEATVRTKHGKTD